MNTEPRDDRNEATRIVDIRHMTENQFAQLGAGKLAYIKPVLIDGHRLFAIHAANGAPMALAEDHDTAQTAIERHELYPASVH